MKEVEQTHACTAYVHLQPVGSTSAQDWQVAVVVQLHGVWADGRPKSFGVGGTFPHREHKTLPAMVYALLAKLDWDIGSEQYIQTGF
jgi:hypothetical protein